MSHVEFSELEKIEALELYGAFIIQFELSVIDAGIEHWKNATLRRIQFNLPKQVDSSKLQYYGNTIEFTSVEELDNLSYGEKIIMDQLVEIRLIGLDDRRLNLLIER